MFLGFKALGFKGFFKAPLVRLHESHQGFKV